jgi:hypothetical protein
MISFKEFDHRSARGVRFVLTDVDDTLTERGRMRSETLAAIERLRSSGLEVIPITGGPAGWCDMMVRMWPVSAAIAESGAIAYWIEEGGMKSMPYPDAVPLARAERLFEAYERLKADHPWMRLGKNQFCRLYDLAVDYAEDEPKISRAEASALRDKFVAQGLRAAQSSIHVNVWLGSYNKVKMAEHFLRERFGFDLGAEPHAALYVGDSPNDEPMFERYPLSVGVANLAAHSGELRHLPRYITSSPCGRGFEEVVDILLSKRA